MSVFVKIVIGCAALVGIAWLAFVIALTYPFILEKFLREDLTGLTPTQIMIRHFHNDTDLHLTSGTISDFLKDAEQGDVGAQLNLFHRYDMGMNELNRLTYRLNADSVIPAKRDICLMRYWLARATRTDDPAAMSHSAWIHGWGLVGKPDPKLSFMYLMKWGEMREYSPEQLIPLTINLDDSGFDPAWISEYQNWSPSAVPLPPRRSCLGCPRGEADDCLANATQ